MNYKLIEPFVEQICNSAVDALRRFCELTDLAPTDMHESFLASYVFDRTGEKISLAPELMVATIWKWNHNEKPMPPGITKQQRIDLTLFGPQEVPKDRQHPWCFIEFERRGSVDTDYWKLKELTRLLECPFGAACCVDRNTESNTRQWLQETTPAGESHRNGSTPKHKLPVLFIRISSRRLLLTTRRQCHDSDRA